MQYLSGYRQPKATNWELILFMEKSSSRNYFLISQLLTDQTGYQAHFYIPACAELLNTGQEVRDIINLASINEVMKD